MSKSIKDIIREQNEVLSKPSISKGDIKKFNDVMSGKNYSKQYKNYNGETGGAEDKEKYR